MAQELLNAAEGTYLLHVARQTIAQALRGEPNTLPDPDPPDRLRVSGASFVTLHMRSGALRGCIGSLVARRPLLEDVQANALAAAFEDPRFPPVTLSELADIIVEVSVLTEPEPLAYQEAEELLKKLRPGVDGVIIEQGWHRATFLPQVWEQLPDPTEFLTNLCYKAGLPGSAWRQGTLNVFTYQVQKFEEQG